MKVTSKSVILAGAVLFLGMPAIAAATGGLIGDCYNCHTMHNSEQGSPVALQNGSTTPTGTANQNLLRYDCITCHANNPTGGTKIYNGIKGTSAIPQVAHEGTTGDLAGGNFSYIITGGNRKGHNVAGAGISGISNDTNGEDGLMGGLELPPGMFVESSADNPHAGAERFTMDSGFLKNFSCAGSAGCHGLRNNAISATLNSNSNFDTNAGATYDGPDYYTGAVRRTGIAAISGGHHKNYDGLKNTTPLASGSKFTDPTTLGADVAAGYRFIVGLKGVGNTVNRWENNDTDHNEYYGNSGATGITGCSTCHQNGSGYYADAEHLYTDGYLKVPNNDMSGFCMTCHGQFHSLGGTNDNDNGGNGSSGAFLRHPTDYTIPNGSEYSNYTTWTSTAPVARPDLTALPGATVVRPGTDRVMCLSCHEAHATPYDGMLRFNYADMRAGDATVGKIGCLACHNTKGTLPAGE